MAVLAFKARLANRHQPCRDRGKIEYTKPS